MKQKTAEVKFETQKNGRCRISRRHRIQALNFLVQFLNFCLIVGHSGAQLSDVTAVELVSRTPKFLGLYPARYGAFYLFTYLPINGVLSPYQWCLLTIAGELCSLRRSQRNIPLLSKKGNVCCTSKPQ